tara:strand:- start:9540 stop:10247 length:708 start_codon:yes stop_codon:yes gene_type:complete
MKPKSNLNKTNKFIISYLELQETSGENFEEVFRKRLYIDIQWFKKQMFDISLKERENHKHLISLISEQAHRQTTFHPELIRTVANKEVIFQHNIKKNMEFFSRPMKPSISEENDPAKHLVNGPNGKYYKILSKPMLDMLERNNKTSTDLCIEAEPEPKKQKKWLISGQAESKRYRCWCHRNIYMKKYIRTELMKDCNTNTTMQICVECGRLWKDVDDYVCHEFYGYTKVEHGVQM